jgi:6,7-dimethyl-8-ribityllumazine synthase
MKIERAAGAAACRFAIVVARFNPDVTAGLLRGARAALAEAGVPDGNVTIVEVPGAFEIPVAARRLAEARGVDAVIALGCVIKGDTMHFEYIASAVSQGIMDVSTATGVPVAFGVLTVLTEEQALERSMDGPANKGREAASAAVDMALVLRDIGRADA